LAIATPKNQDGPNGNAEDVALVGDTVVFVYGLGFVQAKATHHLHKRTDLDDRRWVSCTPDWCPAPGYLEVVLGDHLFYLGTPPGSPALQDRRFVTKAPLVGEDEGASVAVSGVRACPGRLDPTTATAPIDLRAATAVSHFAKRNARRHSSRFLAGYREK
jgi:hypothetical protein